ncbi:MAG TPA: glycosyltransferase [Actinomycetota bacterium]|nr:glycosyltransferase [Actinomycetota bacterium]
MFDRRGRIDSATKRVALISEHASPVAELGGVDAGGQNVYVGELARHLVRMGYDVDVFTRRDAEALPDVAEWVDGVRIVNVPAGPPRFVPKEELLPFMDAFADHVVAFCERQPGGYQIAHANFWMSGLVAAELKRRLRIPFVVTFHALGRVRRLAQGDADRFPDQRFAIEDRVVREADHIIAECPQEEEDLIRLYDADPVRITVIPAGFDPGELHPMSKELARVAVGLRPEDRVVLHVGRMVPRKGVDTVIEALGRLVRVHGMEAILVIAGGDTDRPDPEATPEIGRLQRVARRERVEDRVRFVGRVGREKLKYFYNAADVFVTTPWYEPFGITPLEAMACGTPVIGSNVGGIKFTVRDGETGYLVPPRDPDRVAERLAHLFGHPRLMALFGRQGIRRTNDLFTWRHVATAVAALYEQVCLSGSTDELEHADELAAIERAFAGLTRSLAEASSILAPVIARAGRVLVETFETGGKVLICGNGGSAAEAQHLAAELVGRFKHPDRPGLPALALTSDSAVMTAWSNDVAFEDVFARQIEALGSRGDALLCLSTSGRSRNVVRALETARRAGIRTVAVLGGDGGLARKLCDVAVVVPSTEPQRVQEIHLLVVHLLSEIVEARLFSRPWDELLSGGRRAVAARNDAG